MRRHVLTVSGLRPHLHDPFLQPLRQTLVQLFAAQPAVGTLHVPKHVRDLLSITRLLQVCRDHLWEDDDERAARGKRLVRERLRVGQRDRIVHELERLAASELRELSEDLGGGKVPVEHGRRAEGLEQLSVVRRGGGDDGRKALVLRHLDRCEGVMSLRVGEQVDEAMMMDKTNRIVRLRRRLQ